MKSIRLIKIEATLEETLESGSERFEARYGARLASAADPARQVVGQTLTNVPGGCGESPWGGYLAVDGDSRAVIGTCSFKSPPRLTGRSR
jgi:hypothetical protein